MFSLFFLAFIIYEVNARIENGFDPICINHLKGCNEKSLACGIRKEGEGYRLRIFQNECELIKFGCAVQKHNVYEKSAMHYCDQAFKPKGSKGMTCVEYDCTHPDDDTPVCGRDSRDHRVLLFRNKCRLWEHNCINDQHFNVTSLPDCNGLPIEYDFNGDTIPDLNNLLGDGNFKEEAKVHVENLSSSTCINELEGCDEDEPVCGMRKEGKGYRLRMFKHQCDLIKYGCGMKEEDVYNQTSMQYCDQAFKSFTAEGPEKKCAQYDCSHPGDDVVICAIMLAGKGYRVRLFRNLCRMWEYNCNKKENFNRTTLNICNGLTLDPSHNYGPYYNVITENKQSGLGKSNVTQRNLNMTKESLNLTQENLSPKKANSNLTKKDLKLTKEKLNLEIQKKNLTRRQNQKSTGIKGNTRNSVMDDDELYIKSGSEEDEFPENVVGTTTISDNGENKSDTTNYDTTTTERTTTPKENDKLKNLIVIRGSLKDLNRINETITRFFAATHVFDLPVREMPNDFIDENTRRRLVKIAGPIRVYKPWIVIPKNISDDHDHRPTLNSCYHKCPRKCPPTYAPVCGVPGRIAREPTLMFQNHCFMDVAQCKMFWENKSPTALSSSYQESSFVFCLGDVMNHMYNFLPLVKTLQHMGRLPKKGRFHYRLSNLKFFNNLLAIKDPRIMG